MLSGHDPGRKGSVTPLKAKVMIWVIQGMLANLRRKLSSRAGMPPNSLGGGCHIFMFIIFIPLDFEFEFDKIKCMVLELMF
jgi:hypothetical protein